MNWQHIQYFKVAAEEEHFIRASERLNITQPTLSMAMRSLEKELGFPLFAKSGRNVKLTPSGQMFLVYVDRALGSIDTGIHTIRRKNTEIKGLVNVASLPSFANDILREVIENFTHFYPEVSFVLNVRGAPETMQMVVAGEMDIGFCSENNIPHFAKGLEILDILKDEAVLVASPMHPFARYNEIPVTALEGQKLFNYSSPNWYSKLVSRWLKGIGVSPELHNIAPDAAGLLGLIQEENGICFLPRSPSLIKPDVKVVNIKEGTFLRRIWMVTKPREALSTTTQVFADFFLRTLQNNMVLDTPQGQKRLPNADFYQNMLCQPVEYRAAAT